MNYQQQASKPHQLGCQEKGSLSFMALETVVADKLPFQKVSVKFHKQCLFFDLISLVFEIYFKQSRMLAKI